MSRPSGGVQGCGLVLLLFPVAHAVVQACFDRGLAAHAGTAAWLAGLALLLWSLRMPAGTGQAVAGLLAGFLLWAAVGEIPHQTGRGLHVGPDNWGVLLVVGIYYLVSHAAPGRSFLISILAGAPESARRIHPSRQGLQIAYEFFLMVWGLHVLLLTAYYDPRFGVRSWLTTVIFAAAAAMTPRLLQSVAKIRDLAPGIRAGVLAASLLWTMVEILMKWGVLPKPWKPMHPGAVGACAAALAAWGGWIAASSRRPGAVVS